MWNRARPNSTSTACRTRPRKSGGALCGGTFFNSVSISGFIVTRPSVGVRKKSNAARYRDATVPCGAPVMSAISRKVHSPRVFNSTTSHCSGGRSDIGPCDLFSCFALGHVRDLRVIAGSSADKFSVTISLLCFRSVRRRTSFRATAKTYAAGLATSRSLCRCRTSRRASPAE